MVGINIETRASLLFILLGGLAAASCGSSGGTSSGTGGTGGGNNNPDASPGVPSLSVNASVNSLTLDTCGVTPAVFSGVGAGTYTISLTASTLSKGNAAGSPAVDDYVIVHLPLPPGDPNEVHRFFMLHGVGDTASVTLPATGTIEVMFIDSDSLANNGQATVTLNPGGQTVTVDAVTNVLRWTDGCHSTPATLTVESAMQKAKLVSSSLSAGSGSKDNFVIVRLPLDGPVEPNRYVILNGVGASEDFTPFNNLVVSAWFISATAGGTGEANVSVTSE